MKLRIGSHYNKLENQKDCWQVMTEMTNHTKFRWKQVDRMMVNLKKAKQMARITDKHTSVVTDPMNVEVAQREVVLDNNFNSSRRHLEPH